MAKSSHVSTLLAEVFKRSGMKRAVKRAEAVLLWPQVVGPEVAKFTEAKSLQDGILFVEVSDSETSMHLMMQRQKFLHVYAVKFQVKELRDIRFRVGRPARQQEKKAASSPVQVDPKALARLTRDLSHLPEPLTQPTMQAARAMLAYRERRLAEGWTVCELCQGLSETADICNTCKRYAADPRIQKASHLLATKPTASLPLLSDDEQRVAKHLAKRYLHEKLQELLPQVLADPTYKLELETVAHCYIAHLLDKPVVEVTSEDLDLLESRVARALGRWK